MNPGPPPYGSLPWTPEFRNPAEVVKFAERVFHRAHPALISAAVELVCRFQDRHPEWPISTVDDFEYVLKRARREAVELGLTDDLERLRQLGWLLLFDDDVNPPPPTPRVTLASTPETYLQHLSEISLWNDAFSVPDQLRQDKFGTFISPSSIDIDTLLCSPPSLASSNFPAIVAADAISSTSTTAPAPTADLSSVLRQFTVTNRGQGPVLLLGAAAVHGSYPSRVALSLLDDTGAEFPMLSAGSISSGAPGALQPFATMRRLPPGAQCHLTLRVPLRGHAEGTTRAWVVFALVQEAGSPALSTATAGSAASVAASKPAQVVLVGRHVTLTAKHISERGMRADAPVFYPASVLHMFDTPPVSFFALSALDTFPASALWRPSTAHRPWLEAYRPDLSDAAVKHARALHAQIAMEELAWWLLNKQLDLHYTTATVKAVQTADTASALMELSVEGLPEGRPALMAGYPVWLRFDSASESEFLCRVNQVRQAAGIVELRVPVFRAAAMVPGTQLQAHVRFGIDPFVPAVLWDAVSTLMGSFESLGLLSQRPPPVTAPIAAAASAADIRPYTKPLNEAQTTVVQSVLRGRGIRQPFLVIGPPGTGKTITMVECVLQTLKAAPKSKILLCAPSDSAADTLCAGLLECLKQTPGDPIRLDQVVLVCDPRRNPRTIRNEVFGHRLHDSDGTLTVRPMDELLRQFSVVVATCVACAHTGLSVRRAPSHVFIDEAAQASEPESYLPLLFADGSTQIVLAGDPFQLGPEVRSAAAFQAGYGRSLLERLYRSQSNFVQLVENYRSHPAILNISSRRFYQNKLVCADPEPPRLTRLWTRLPNMDSFPVAFFGVPSGRQSREGEANSFYNLMEAVQVVEMVMELVKTQQVCGTDAIGVLAPYRAQVQKIRELLRAQNFGDVRVGTVDDYQGQEAAVIIVSTTLTNTVPASSGATDGSSSEEDLLFTQEARRFNVAVSRAKALLLVVGHPVALARDPHWSFFLQYCIENNAVVTLAKDLRQPGTDRPSDSASGAFLRVLDQSLLATVDQHPSRRL